MKTVNLLKFIKNTRNFYSLIYAQCPGELPCYIDIVSKDEQIILRHDFGVFFVNQKNLDTYLMIDGLCRLLSVSLFIFALCECYKKINLHKENKISDVKLKYLIHGNTTKLHLPPKEDIIYKKLILGEKLSSKEKTSKIFVLFHKYWRFLSSSQLTVKQIFDILKKIHVTVAETDGVVQRDLYYNLHCGLNLDNIVLLDDYFKENGVYTHWHEIKEIFTENPKDLTLFVKDYLTTKLDNKTVQANEIYKYFTNYFETMMQYISEDEIIKKIKRAAKLYYKLLYIEVENENIRKLIIQIKKLQGEDTFAYLLDVYNDYIDKNINESTFLEILLTIIEFLQNRIRSGNDIDFNELVKYLNAFIACK